MTTYHSHKHKHSPRKNENQAQERPWAAPHSQRRRRRDEGAKHSPLATQKQCCRCRETERKRENARAREPERPSLAAALRVAPTRSESKFSEYYRECVVPTTHRIYFLFFICIWYSYNVQPWRLPSIWSERPELRREPRVDVDVCLAARPVANAPRAQ